jgi:hypothetical protein
MAKKKNKRNNTRQHVQKNFDPVLVEVTEQHQAAQSEIDIEEYMILKNAWNESEQTFDIHTMKEELKKTAEEQAIAMAESAFEAIHKERVEKSMRLQHDIDVAQKLLAELEKKEAALNEAIVQQEAKASMRAEQIISEAESKAKREAEKIVKKAHIDAERANEELTASLKKKETEILEKEAELESRIVALEADRIELERQVKLNERRRDILKEKAELYADASPEKVSELLLTISNNKAYIDSLLAEMTELQSKINQNRLLEMRMGERTAADILKENSELHRQIEILQNKCNEFTTYQLEEMKRALDSEPGLLSEIERLKREVVGYKSELIRYENAQLELEAVKAQIELIKSLNTHLKEELLACKRTLEAQSGEICPNLTRIDRQERNKDCSALVKAQAFTTSWTLPEIITHIRNYAANRQVPLYYTYEDISAFIAGLASSKISILQGLSGTGKTSLPIVFTEAISGESHIIPVESSWRDRNELLGYYNDFNKKFTAKDFTCSLYRANHSNYSNVPFFIVLDEMNLSRVEYYFADFLSVLENPDKDKWLVSLVDVSLEGLPSQITVQTLDELKQNIEDEVRQAIEKVYGDDGKLSDIEIDAKERQIVLDYFKKMAKQNAKKYGDCFEGPENLINGNTLRIPDNVWFIGTANRDESTFEITDKVYDRAQVLNFLSKARSFTASNVNKVAISFNTLKKRFDEAEAKYKKIFNYSEDNTITTIDEFLEKNFKISFGNRIGKQINTFVWVYLAAGQGCGKSDNELIAEAIDYQIANKVLRKLEHIDITRVTKFKELRDECELCGLTQCVNIIEARIEADS